VITFNQSKVSIIDKNLFNHMKVSKQNQSKVSIEFINPFTHMINMRVDLKSLFSIQLRSKGHS